MLAQASANGSLLPTGLIKECDWLTAFAYRIVIRPRGRPLRYVASATIQLRRIGAFVDAVEVRNSGEIGRVCGLCLSAGRVCQGVPGRAGRHRPQWDERPVSAHSPDLRT
jgi:hypothetical protein